MSIKGTPLDPNFGYHGADDYMKMLGEGQAANAYVATDQRSEPEKEAAATEAEAPRLPTDIFADLGRDYPDAQRLLDDNATYDRTHGILPEDSHPYGPDSWRDTAETHRALGTLAYPDARPATH